MKLIKFNQKIIVGLVLFAIVLSVSEVEAGKTYIENGSVFENVIEQDGKKVLTRKEYKDGKIYITIKIYDGSGNLIREKEITRSIKKNVVIVPAGDDPKEVADQEAKVYFDSLSESDAKALKQKKMNEQMDKEVQKKNSKASEEGKLLKPIKEFKYLLKTENDVEVEETNGDFKVKSGAGKEISVSLSPDEAVMNTLQGKPFKVGQVAVEVFGDQVVYDVSVQKVEKLLGLIRTKIFEIHKYDAVSGKFVEVQKSWYNKLLDLVSF